jgi:gamma-glutamyl hercynylcysteine S-oxide synthase
MLAAQGEVAVRHQLLERVSDARRRSDALFNIVRSDSLYERPIPERHRIIFYVGHLEAFDWNLLHENVLGLKSFHPQFDRLFAFGIDPVGGGLPSDHPSDWPSLDAVRDYVSRIRVALDDKLADGSLESFSQTRDGFPLDTLLNVAVEHRLMHVETLAYMLHQLPLDRKVSPENLPSPVTPPVTPQMIQIPAGVATLGLARCSDIFGWDNEYETHSLHVHAFEIDQYEVTNGQYLDFMAGGGYETEAFWSGGDWKWKTAHAISHPVFWRKVADGWRYRTMFEQIPLPLDWPVYVSHAEAMAYARWAGKSLPSEEQWHRAAFGTHDGIERRYPWGNETWGDEKPSAGLGNFDFSHWNPTPVNAFPEGQSAFGVHDMLGNSWEWTSTVFAPFPGFEPFPFYRGYSADFFDGKHFVMKGGSPRTAASMLRPTFRNWFQAHYQYVYAGFRCVNH